MDNENVLDRPGQCGESAHPIGLSQSSSYRAKLVVTHDGFVARKVGCYFVCWTERNPGGGSYSCHRRAIHDEDIITGATAAHRSTRPDLVVSQVYVAAVRRVAVDRVPLPIYRGVGHAGVATGKGRAEIIRAGGAEVRKRQIIEIKMTCDVDSELGIAPAVAGGHLALERGGTDDPLEGLTGIEGAPDPTSVSRRGPGCTGVKAIRIGRVQPQILLESHPRDPADDGMPESRCACGRRSARRRDH